MAYITNHRKRVSEIIGKTISDDVIASSYERREREKEMERIRDDWDKSPTNPKNRKKLRESGQPDEKQLDLFSLRNLQRTGRDQQAGQRNFDPRRSLSFVAEPMRIAREYTFSDPRSGNPLSIMHHQSGKTSVDPGTPERTRYYWDGGVVPSTDLPAKINPFPGAMIPEDDNNRIIPEDPGRPMMIAGSYRYDHDPQREHWKIEPEIGPKAPFVSGPTSKLFDQKIQEFKQKYFKGV